MIAESIDSIIMFAGGAYATAMGYGWLPASSKNPAAGEKWMLRYGKLLKIVGPLLVVVAVALWAARFFGDGA